MPLQRLAILSPPVSVDFMARMNIMGALIDHMPIHRKLHFLIPWSQVWRSDFLLDRLHVMTVHSERIPGSVIGGVGGR